MSDTPYSEDRSVRGNELQPAAITPTEISRMPEFESTADAPDGTVFRDSTGRTWYKHQNGIVEPFGASTVRAPRAELADGDRYEIAVPIQDNTEVKVYRWGVFTHDNDAPAGLEIGISAIITATPVESENTEYTAFEGTDPPDMGISGDDGYGYVAAINNTGTDFVQGNDPDSVYFFMDYTLVPQ